MDQMPEGFGVRVLSDQSYFIEDAVNDVSANAALGALLSVLVIFLFLRSIKITVLNSISIPICIIATFIPMRMWGVSLNVMSLGGLAMGVGMVVDNSTVVLESIERCRQEGDDMLTAAVRGISEVGGAIMAGTLTTVAVFFPIVFVTGIAGLIFRDQALTVVFSMLASLVVAQFVVPALFGISLAGLSHAGGFALTRKSLGYLRPEAGLSTWRKILFWMNRAFQMPVYLFLLLFIAVMDVFTLVFRYVLRASGRSCASCSNPWRGCSTWRGS